jgi:hypothetical protein
MASFTGTQKFEATGGERKDAKSHDERIRTFIGFVEFLVVNSRQITLKFEHVQEMFRIFVTEAATEAETRVFFEFLTKEN